MNEIDRPSSIKAIFDAMTCNSSADGCDGDWRREVIEGANPLDVRKVRDVLSSTAVLSEAAWKLGTHI